MRKMPERLEAYWDEIRKNLVFRKGDRKDYNFVLSCLRSYEPDTV